MDALSMEADNYLNELYKMTTGNAGAQVSMYAVGTAVGLEKEAAGKIAEDLIGSGLVEVKTLSGGIGITDSGIEAVQAAGAGGPAAAGFDPGTGPVLEDKGREAIAVLIKDIQTHISRSGAAYEQLEEMVIDLKTIEVQLLSPNPKTAIVREVLRSLQPTLKSTGNPELSKIIGKMVAA